MIWQTSNIKLILGVLIKLLKNDVLQYSFFKFVIFIDLPACHIGRFIIPFYL